MVNEKLFKEGLVLVLPSIVIFVISYATNIPIPDDFDAYEIAIKTLGGIELQSSQAQEILDRNLTSALFLVFIAKWGFFVLGIVFIYRSFRV